MKMKTNLVAAFALTFCFAGIPNLGGCDRNGDATAPAPAPAPKPVEQNTRTVTKPDGTKEVHTDETVKNSDGSVTHHSEDKKSTP